MTGDPEDPPEEGRTVFIPPTSGPSAQPEPPPAAPAAPAPVQVGAVLNHIYEVKRFLGRGGMGEVYEGCNINTDERVAIKVMLPSLAADPNVQAMFRKEARTLTKLSHPALVPYRVLAQEPTLGVLYIVTEFVDGAPLCDLLGEIRPTADELRGLLRRLAQGLGAAHALGVVHRDMSPDNVLLPDRRLSEARIIDFGIAKDLDPSKATIVGDGFAGKLGYVAPEQFGDYSREIGPWTDVYSLGLVILATALGRDVDMGTTLVEAVDRRRAGPDLSPIPAELRPVLERMLAPDPANRFRSMDEVLAALEPAAPIAAAAPSPDIPRTVFQPSPPKPEPAKPAAGTKKSAVPLPLLLGGGALALAILAGGGFFLMRGGGDEPAAPPAAAGGVPQAERARQAIEAALPGIRCTWLDITRAADEGGGVALSVAGVAGSPAAAQAAVAEAASKAGVVLAEMNLQDVAPVQSEVCEPLNVFRAIRADTSANGRRLSSAQTKYEIMRQDNGILEARAVIEMALRDPSLNFAIFGLEPTGEITALAESRAAFQALAQGNPLITVEPNDTYKLSMRTDHQGWSGILLLTGQGPFAPELVAAPPSGRGPDWNQKVLDAARASGWRAEMVWYRTADQQPN